MTYHCRLLGWSCEKYNGAEGKMLASQDVDEATTANNLTKTTIDDLILKIIIGSEGKDDYVDADECGTKEIWRLIS